MKLDVCVFSGVKIYPGHGKRYVRVDGRTCNFVSRKCASLYMQRKNPRKIRCGLRRVSAKRLRVKMSCLFIVELTRRTYLVTLDTPAY